MVVSMGLNYRVNMFPESHRRERELVFDGDFDGAQPSRYSVLPEGF